MPKTNNSNLSNEKQKEIKWSLDNFKRIYQKHIYQLVLIWVMALNQLLWKLTKKNLPIIMLFWRSRKIIYNLYKIMLHITPWILTVMLHIRQSVYLILANVLSTSFLIFHITFDAQHCLYNFGIKVDILDTSGAMICSFFGIVFPLFF